MQVKNILNNLTYSVSPCLVENTEEYKMGEIFCLSFMEQTNHQNVFSWRNCTFQKNIAPVDSKYKHPLFNRVNLLQTDLNIFIALDIGTYKSKWNIIHSLSMASERNPSSLMLTLKREVSVQYCLKLTQVMNV